MYYGAGTPSTVIASCMFDDITQLMVWATLPLAQSGLSRSCYGLRSVPLRISIFDLRLNQIRMLLTTTSQYANIILLYSRVLSHRSNLLVENMPRSLLSLTLEYYTCTPPSLKQRCFALLPGLGAATSPIPSESDASYPGNCLVPRSQNKAQHIEIITFPVSTPAITPSGPCLLQ